MFYESGAPLARSKKCMRVRYRERNLLACLQEDVGRELGDEIGRERPSFLLPATSSSFVVVDLASNGDTLALDVNDRLAAESLDQVDPAGDGRKMRALCGRMEVLATKAGDHAPAVLVTQPGIGVKCFVGNGKAASPIETETAR